MGRATCLHEDAATECMQLQLHPAALAGRRREEPVVPRLKGTECRGVVGGTMAVAGEREGLHLQRGCCICSALLFWNELARGPAVNGRVSPPPNRELVGGSGRGGGAECGGLARRAIA